MLDLAMWELWVVAWVCEGKSSRAERASGEGFAGLAIECAR